MGWRLHHPGLYSDLLVAFCLARCYYSCHGPSSVQTVFIFSSVFLLMSMFKKYSSAYSNPNKATNMMVAFPIWPARSSFADRQRNDGRTLQDIQRLTGRRFRYATFWLLDLWWLIIMDFVFLVVVMVITNDALSSSSHPSRHLSAIWSKATAGNNDTWKSLRAEIYKKMKVVKSLSEIHHRH